MIRRPRTSVSVIVGICAAFILEPLPLLAQVNDRNPQIQPYGLSATARPSPSETSSDSALEITPRTATSQPPTTSSPNEQESNSGELGNSIEPELPPLPTSGPPASMLSAARVSSRPLPYLGLTVQRILSHSKPGRSIEGLEIVSVDHNSPAEKAGLKGRVPMTSIGASAATAGALMAPLDIALMPLLKKTGQLGGSGDLIVAVDDRRVTSETDLQTALANAQPGDTIYLTLVRMDAAGSRKILKVPVKLGKSVAN